MGELEAGDHRGPEGEDEAEVARVRLALDRLQEADDEVLREGGPRPRKPRLRQQGSGEELADSEAVVGGQRLRVELS